MKPHEQIAALGEWDRRFRGCYGGECLLRDILPNESCSDLSWNHIIGREFLREVKSKDNQILYWDMFSGKMLAIQSMGTNKLPGERLLEEINEFRPSKVGIDNIRCQIKGACNRHDHKAFEPIETPIQFKGDDPAHQARMSLRAAFLETAFLSTSVAWIKNWRFVNPAILREWRTLDDLRDSSQNRLSSWIDIIGNSKSRRVYTEYTKEPLPIRVAACGTAARLGVKSSPSTFSLMPRTDGLTDVLVSCLDAESRGCRTPEQDAEADAVRDVVRLLKDEPTEGIRQLLRVTDQVFLNPDDYDNRSVITEAEKVSLEEEIAGYRAKETQRVNQATGVRFGKRGRHRGYIG